MTLLTVDELREHIETALGDDALERVLNSSEQAITAWAGPLDWDAYEELVGDITETVYAPGKTLLPLHQTPAAVVTVTDWQGTSDVELAEDDDYRIRGDALERANGYRWGSRTVVEYTPINTRAQRILALVELCQLELNREPGMTSQGAGPWSETYGQYDEERARILRTLWQPELFA